jgi:DNA-binding MarR family transcriptional regulator
VTTTLTSTGTTTGTTTTGTTPALDADELRRVEASLLSIVRGVMHPSHQFDSGLDKAGYITLVHLDRCTAVRQTELAARMNLDLSTVSRQVRTLEELGLVRRDADPDDGRAQVLAVTAAGRREITRQRVRRWGHIGDRLAEVPEPDRTRFLDFLEQLAETSPAHALPHHSKTGRTSR